MRKRLILFSILAILVNSCFLFRPSAKKQFRSTTKSIPYDAIIVPGVPFDGKEWSMVMRGRVIWASYLYKKGITKNIIFSGGAVYTPYIEAKIMALYANALGVPKENIFTEEKAEHSTENIYYSYWIAKSKGFTKIAVATDPFQSNMLVRFSKKRFKLPIKHIPFLTDTLKTIHDISTPKINTSLALKENFVSIVEAQSKWKRFKGTSGRNIVYLKEE